MKSICLLALVLAAATSALNQVAFEVVGNDVTISMAAEAGQLQLNAFEPIIAHSLFKSLTHLDAASRALIDKCVTGITANADRLYESVVNSIGYGSP